MSENENNDDMGAFWDIAETVLYHQFEYQTTVYSIPDYKLHQSELLCSLLELSENEPVPLPRSLDLALFFLVERTPFIETALQEACDSAFNEGTMLDVFHLAAYFGLDAMENYLVSFLVKKANAIQIKRLRDLDFYFHPRYSHCFDLPPPQTTEWSFLRDLDPRVSEKVFSSLSVAFLFHYLPQRDSAFLSFLRNRTWDKKQLIVSTPENERDLIPFVIIENPYSVLRHLSGAYDLSNLEFLDLLIRRPRLLSFVIDVFRLHSFPKVKGVCHHLCTALRGYGSHSVANHLDQYLSIRLAEWMR